MSPASGGYHGLGHFGEQLYWGIQQPPDAIDHGPYDQHMFRHAMSRPMYSAPQTSVDQVAYVIPDGRGQLACTVLGSNTSCQSCYYDVEFGASRRRTRRRRSRRRRQKHVTIGKQNQLPLVSGTMRRGMTLSLTSLLEWNDPDAVFVPTRNGAVSRGSSSAGQWKIQHHARSRDALFPI
jgi:hypothetical protein